MRPGIRARKRSTALRLHRVFERDPFLRAGRTAIRVDDRSLSEARAECAELARESESEPTMSGYCRRCKVTRLSRADRGGLCLGCQATGA